MPLTSKLLMILHPDVRVVDCADCGRLCTFEWAAYKQHARDGLLLAGGWRPRRSGHRQPLCVVCKQETPADWKPHSTSWD